MARRTCIEAIPLGEPNMFVSGVLPGSGSGSLAAALGILKLLAAAAWVWTSWLLPQAAAAVIPGVTIESVSSELTLDDGGFSREAENIVNGRGLIGRRHSANAESEMWDADTFVPPLSSRGTDNDPQITFDLGAVFLVDSILAWNFNALGLTGRGVDELELLASIDNVVFDFVANASLDEAPGNNLYMGQVVEPNQFVARYVRFDIISNHQGDPTFGIGLAEIQFTGTVIPEASNWASSLLAVASLVVGARCSRPKAAQS